ncbi:MAG TPA: hypothetical protein VFE82_09100 [Ramlibacter sp.]|jgi:hypothetical protein|uniref:hypothetical protein n=1 Tax=Ramlibacter sp. TaxID=1917967 RepID=UPI002D757BB1|nr:hypothetical protein [Ramlibacter sp.]HZY18627.1 hypothetical protein [Ramlibacter sp.]
MRVLICSIDVDPCPPQNVQTLSLADSIDPALFGITPERMAYIFSGGLGMVLSFWALGLCVGLAVGLIRKA